MEAIVILLMMAAVMWVGLFIIFKVLTWLMPGIVHDPDEVKRKDLQKELQNIQQELKNLKEK